MKNIYKNKLLLAVGFFAFSLLAILGIQEGSAFAATKTWTNGSNDGKWSTAGNWSPAGAPTNGDDLVFDTGDTNGGGDNDIANLQINTIAIDNTDGVTYSISTEESMTITSSIISTGAPVVFRGGFILGGDVEIRDVNLSNNVLGSPLNQVQLNGNALTYNSVTNYTLTGIVIPITGTGSVSYDVGNKPLPIAGVNTYSGTTNIVDAQYVTNQGIAINEMFGTSSVTVSGEGSLLLVPSNSGTSLTNNITFAGFQSADSLFTTQLTVTNNASAFTGTVTIPNITLNGNVRFDAYDGVTVNLSGITANGHCVQYGDASNNAAGRFTNGPAACVVDGDEEDSEGNTVGAPDTGLGILTANPIATLGATTLAAGSIAALSRRAGRKMNRR